MAGSAASGSSLQVGHSEAAAVSVVAGEGDGVADGVDSRGALRVRHGDAVATYDSAEVTVRAR